MCEQMIIMYSWTGSLKHVLTQVVSIPIWYTVIMNLKLSCTKNVFYSEFVEFCVLKFYWNFSIMYVVLIKYVTLLCSLCCVLVLVIQVSHSLLLSQSLSFPLSHSLTLLVETTQVMNELSIHTYHGKWHMFRCKYHIITITNKLTQIGIG